MNNLNLAAIGNCQIAALLDEKGRVVWFCSPRLDSEPVFSALLSGQDEPEHGFFDVLIDDYASSEQRYVRNTAVVETILHDRSGGGSAPVGLCAPIYPFWTSVPTGDAD